MKMNHFLSIADYSEPELMHILDVSRELKAELKAGGNQFLLEKHLRWYFKRQVCVLV